MVQHAASLPFVRVYCPSAASLTSMAKRNSTSELILNVGLPEAKASKPTKRTEYVNMTTLELPGATFSSRGA